MLVILRQLLGRELVNRVSAFVLRKSRVGQNRNVLGRIQPQVTDCVVHLPGPVAQFRPMMSTSIRLKRSQRRADFRAEQHGAGILQA